MYKQTVVRVRPSTDVQWPDHSPDKPNVLQVYGLHTEVTESEDQLTRTGVRVSDDQSLLSDIEEDFADPTSKIYWITQHCIDNNIAVTITLGQI